MKKNRVEVIRKLYDGPDPVPGSPQAHIRELIQFIDSRRPLCDCGHMFSVDPFMFHLDCAYRRSFLEGNYEPIEG